MKNKIIKTICFSLLALSVALCAVFTLPKRDNLNVNAQTNINPNIYYVTDIPFNSYVVEYVAEGNVQSWAYFPLDLSFYGLNTDFFGFVFNDFDNSDFSLEAINSLDDNFITFVGGSTSFDFVLATSLSAYDFFFDTSNIPSNSPTIEVCYFDESNNLIPIMGDYTVTISYIVPTPGEEASISSASFTSSSVSSFSFYEVFQRLLPIDFPIIYVKTFFVHFHIFDISYPNQPVCFLVTGMPYTYFNDVESYSVLFLNQWDSNREVIEYQVDFFASIVQSVDSFMKTEFLPNVSFYDLLLFCIVIPLVVVVLKMWLGG